MAQKCTFCNDRVDDGLARGLTPGVDPEATPACSASCIAQAIKFGDFNDPASNVSQLVRDNEHFQMHAGLGTDPQIKYLYTTPAVPGRDISAAETDDERQSDPANPLVGPLQKFWDWRAAMNWCFGGVSSGFAVLSGLGAAFGLIDPARLPMLFTIAAALMAIGLFFVFLKIGRQLRFWRAIARPQTSWMTRELYAVAVFYPAVFLMMIGWGNAAIAAIATIAAGAFLVCQAKILHRARGIPAWRVPLMPAMIVATGLAEGFGALLVFAVAASGLVITLVGVILAALNAWLWRSYVSTARAQGIPPLARAVIDAITPFVHAIGHALPVFALLIAGAAPGIGKVLLVIAGIAYIAGGMLWKYTVIVHASYQQGFALARAPQRGSGTCAAPARLGGVEQPRPV